MNTATLSVMSVKDAIRAISRGNATSVPHDMYLSLIRREMIKHDPRCGLVVTTWGLEYAGISFF